jgi:hypothetical protein
MKMNVTKLVLSTSAFVAGFAAAAPEAQAAEWIVKQDSAEDRPLEVGILVGVPYCCNQTFNLSPGVLVGIPLVDKGFVPINDSFYLEVGAWTHIQFDPSSFGMSPFGGVRWNFHLMEVWDAYAAARVAVRLGFGEGQATDLNLGGALGTTWKFSKSVGLRGEFGGGLLGGDVSVGVDIDF